MPSQSVSFSVIVPLFKTAEYLPDLLGSLATQTEGPFTVEYIFVDDGSPDRSAEIAEFWLRDSNRRGSVIRQANAGVSAARNAGIRAASGDWIALPDSDDFVNENFLSAAASLIRSVGQKAHLISTNVIRYDEASNEFQDVHPLRTKFSRTSTLISLNEEPKMIQSQAASAIFRRQIIIENELHFLPGLHVAEDAIFVSNYLLSVKNPTIAVSPDSKYFYRIRKSQDSAVNTYRSNPDFYFGRFDHGYIPTLERAVRESGTVPTWLQMLVLYDLRWYFPREMKPSTKATHLSPAERRKALELVTSVLAFIEEASVINYDVTGLSPEIRALWLALKQAEIPDHARARIGEVTPTAVEIRYLSTRVEKEEVWSHRGPCTILHRKTRRIDYFGQEVLRERILWVKPADGLGLLLDGNQVPLRRGSYSFLKSKVSLEMLGFSRPGTRDTGAAELKAVPLLKQWLRMLSVQVASRYSRLTNNPRILRDAGVVAKQRAIRSARQNAQTPRSFKRYTRAWILMDRLHAAQDNAEYLYQYLANNHPKINIWFVLEKSSADWKRLSSAGFKLLRYGSREHVSALLNAEVVASSHLDVEIVRPIPEEYYRKGRPWQFVYLQHGVRQHNLSTWFNSKSIDLLTTATPDEHYSIVEDGSDYRLTEQTVKLTGFPRHDIIRSNATTREWAARSMILVAPTWRDSLFAPKSGHGSRRHLIEPFQVSEYGKEWLKFLNCEALHDLVSIHQARIVFLPHPNFRGLIDQDIFPKHVELMSEVNDLQALISHARVTVTDYSSISFDAAIADSRTVYFQFDAENYLHGSHTYTPGYWSYPEHGFGPIAYTAPDAAKLTLDAFTSGDDYTNKIYEKRIHSTFPMLDGNASARIVNEIQTMLGSK